MGAHLSSHPAEYGRNGADLVYELSGRPETLGQAAAMQEVFRAIGRLSQSNATVLITGESGTGKQLLAEAIHKMDPKRSRRPFLSVNCAAITGTLAESALFGHKKGAFTNADRDHKGLFEVAGTGTLFLDEIGDLHFSLQAKLLRVFQEQKIRAVGDNKFRAVNVRIITATHKNLAEEIREQRFREDLYYRLDVFPIGVPPLRERIDDLPLLVHALLARIAPHRALRLDAKAMAALRAHRFPGNIRELRNLLERAALLADRETIGLEELALDAVVQRSETPMPSAGPGRVELPDPGLSSGSRRELARRLGISERTLYRRLREAKQAGD